MSAVIIASGSQVDINVIKEENIHVDYVICADGGLEKAARLNLIPNIIIGDLDSVNSDVLNYYLNKNVPMLKFPKEKDYTDMELAIEHAIEKDFDDIILIGATGTRLDHTMTNILLIEKYFKRGIKIKIIDNNNIIQMAEQGMELNNRKNSYVSIVPVSDKISGVTLKGFKYPLNDVEVKRGSTLCISNEISEESGSITIKEGNAILFLSKD